jgi:hypothetical protein
MITGISKVVVPVDETPGRPVKPRHAEGDDRAARDLE